MMPFCRVMIQQIFESESTSTDQSSDSLSSTLLNAIKSALEKDQSAGLELLASLDNALTDKVRRLFSVLFNRHSADLTR